MNDTAHNSKGHPGPGHEPHSVEIFVNTRPVEYDNDTIDYTQAVDIAFPNIPKGPDATFLVTFTGARGSTTRAVRSSKAARAPGLRRG